MHSSNLIRQGGLAAMLGGVAFIVDGLLGLGNKDAPYLTSYSLLR